MYGSLSPAIAEAMAPFVRGKRVLDLGCGDGERASALLDLGASAVLAVDKEPRLPRGLADSTRLSVLQGRFTDQEVAWQAARWSADVVHVAWPQNNRFLGDVPWIKLFGEQCTIYVGCNVDGSACGSPSMFEYFRTREVLCCIPERRNTLLVYGKALPKPRTFVYAEEFGGLGTETQLSFDPRREPCYLVGIGSV